MHNRVNEIQKQTEWRGTAQGETRFKRPQNGLEMEEITGRK